MNKITFTVIAERIRTKPRMTRRDNARNIAMFGMRPIVKNWYEWRNNVAWTYKQKGGRCFDVPVSIKFWFRLRAKKKGKKELRDLDNLEKGVVDALSKGVAFVDDTVEYVRRHEDSDVEFINVGAESAIITIRPYSEGKNE